MTKKYTEKRPGGLAEADIRRILERFSIREYTSSPISFGHINHSFHVECSGKNYVLQCLSPLFSDDRVKTLVRNYHHYVKACGDKDPDNWFYPIWEKDTDGQEFVRDPDGRFWRFYEEIPGEIRLQNADPQILGEGLAVLHGILDLIDGRIPCAIPGYRELDGYYECYLQALSVSGNDTERCGDIEKMIAADIDHFRGLKLSEDKVIHGDTKQSNAVFSGGRVIAWIDLDTLMTGDRCMDVADALRSSAK